MKIVTIQKVVDKQNVWYWIVDENDNMIDGFSKKYQALDAIKRWNMIRKNKTIKTRI